MVKDWLEGDPDQPEPPSSRSRNLDWKHLFNRDIISMPDKWEYPWVCIDDVTYMHQFDAYYKKFLAGLLEFLA